MQLVLNVMRNDIDRLKNDIEKCEHEGHKQYLKGKLDALELYADFIKEEIDE